MTPQIPRLSGGPPAHGRIDMAQFMAGRKFQRHFAIADKRHPADLERERPDALTETN